jgi:predicted anti-sigma-YlaC factor YlaD
MLRRICDHEPDMLGAAAARREDAAAVRAHLASCPSCREAVATVCWMRRMADASGETRALPDPGVIWWKAQLLRRWESERRAVAPLEHMHVVELVAGLASLGVFVAWQWSGLVNVLARLSPANLAAMSAASASGTSPLVFVLVLGATLAVGGMIFASLHRRLNQ